MRKSIKLFSLLAVLAISSPVLAADSPTVTVSGLVDSYYSLNITNMSADPSAAGNGNGVFYGFNTKDNNFTLGLAEVGVKAALGEATANVILFYGEVADITYNPGSPDMSPGQFGLMSANLAITKDIWTFTFGKFMTWMGNEVMESKSNMNYSRSILFYGIPLYHTGFSVGVAPDSQFGATLFVTNGWNNQNAYTFTAGEKTLGLQVKATPKDSGFTAILNGIFGPAPSAAPGRPTLVGELILSYAVDKLTFGLDAQMGMQSYEGTGAPDPDSYIGAALYAKVALEEGWGIALRLEEVVDNNTIIYALGTPTIGYELREATLTIENQMTANVLVRLEGRYDMDVMNGIGTGAYAGGEDNQMTVTASTVFSF